LRFAQHVSAFARLINIIGPFLGLVLVIVLFSLSPTVRPHFLTGENFRLILSQTVIVGVGALGMTLIIVSGGIDLSVGSVVALTSVVGAQMVVRGHASAVVAALITILAGAGIGAVNGAAIGGLRMIPFIVTLGMMGIARGAAKWMANNGTVNLRADDGTLGPEAHKLEALMTSPTAPQTWHVPAFMAPVVSFVVVMPAGVWIVIGLAVITGLMMRCTVFGRYVFAIGANEAAARLSGVRVRVQKVSIYTLAGAFFGVAGLMQLSQLTQGDPTGAIGLELDIIAAVVIGGASLSGGSGSVLGSMIGALIMAVLRNGSTQMDWPNYMQEIIIGLVIIFAVAMDQLRQKGRRAGEG
jgi:ribose transport system permease protein